MRRTNGALQQMRCNRAVVSKNMQRHATHWMHSGPVLERRHERPDELRRMRHSVQGVVENSDAERCVRISRMQLLV